MNSGSKLRDRRKPAVGRESVSRRLGLSGARVLKAALALGSVAILAAAYGLSPDLRESVNEIAGSLARRDLEAARRYVLSFGAWAPLVSLALMVLQAVVAPIPAFALNVVNGLVFGALWGFVLSLAGRALAASVCFGLARALGRGAVEALVGERGIRRSDRWFEEWGARAVLVTRLVPFFSFDLVSYAAGLTGIRFSRFLLATVAGEIPAVALYSWVGGRAPDYLWLLLLVNAAIFAIVATVSLLRRRRGR